MTLLRFPVTLALLLMAALTYAAPARNLASTQTSPGDEVSVVLIAHPGVPTKGLDAADLKSIFLGKTTKWSNGKKISFVNLTRGATHKVFTKLHTGKTESQYRNYWKKLVFTGKGKMPQVFTTERKLLDYVAKTPEAIGYISKKLSEDTVAMTDPKTKKSKVQTITTK